MPGSSYKVCSYKKKMRVYGSSSKLEIADSSHSVSIKKKIQRSGILSKIRHHHRELQTPQKPEPAPRPTETRPRGLLVDQAIPRKTRAQHKVNLYFYQFIFGHLQDVGAPCASCQYISPYNAVLYVLNIDLFLTFSVGT